MKGSFGEAKVMAYFLGQGYSVSIPYGNNESYDLIVDTREVSGLVRVQVKYAKIYRGSITVPLHKPRRRGQPRENYDNKDFDTMVVYCPDNNCIYEIDHTRYENQSVHLRVSEAKNKQKCKINWHEDFMIANLSD